MRGPLHAHHVLRLYTKALYIDIITFHSSGPIFSYSRIYLRYRKDPLGAICKGFLYPQCVTSKNGFVSDQIGIVLVCEISYNVYQVKKQALYVI